MTLRTDIFQHADDSLEEWNPCDNGYEWVPTDFSNFIAVTHFADVTKVIANDVYRHLVLWEDIDAIHDGRYMEHHDTWLAREYNKAPPLWKSLMEAAIKEKQVWKKNECNIYVRPSLWFLREDWMNEQLCTFVVDRIPSITFYDGKAENQIIYLKTASTETLADMILEGEIDDDDIPENKYEEVYSEIRQK
jgi:hypothetical protein